MKPIHPNNKPFRDFLQFWERLCTLEDYHAKWASSHMELIAVKRLQVLHGDGMSQKAMFIVSRGLLANVQYASGRPRILNIALTNMSLTTTTHLFSGSYVPGEIVALRAGLVFRIPYRNLLEPIQMDPCFSTLISALGNKQLRFLHLIRCCCLLVPPRERYRQFSLLLPEVLKETTQREHAALLGISRDTVQKTKKELLFSRF